MAERKIKFISKTVKWFDKVNGNTYHSNRIIRVKDSKTIVTPFTYGYGEQYKTTALETMQENKWIPRKYWNENKWWYCRENNYPIHWEVSHGLKRDCIANGSI